MQASPPETTPESLTADFTNLFARWRSISAKSLQMKPAPASQQFLDFQENSWRPFALFASSRLTLAQSYRKVAKCAKESRRLLVVAVAAPCNSRPALCC